MFDLIPSRLSRRTRYARPSLLLFFCLVGAFLLTVLPHLPQLPPWISGSILVAMIIRSVIEVRRWRLPSPSFCGVLALCLLAAVYLHFDTIFGRDAGTAFMSGLLAIKFFEIRGPRDVALIIFCSFFLVMSSLLYSQAVELFIYCLIMMWVLTALLLRTSMGDLPDNRLLYMLRTSALIFFQALPLTLFLFFFFPRYRGVLELGISQGSIGLTDRIEPGSIASLANDHTTAMTVKMSGRFIPNVETLYWRAIVLWTYEHGAWIPGAAAYAPKDRTGALPLPVPDSSPVTQEITIWPHFHQWLFALDYPVTEAVQINGSPGWSEALPGDVLSLRDKTLTVNHKLRYIVTSSPQIVPEKPNPGLEAQALELPEDKGDTIDPGVRALAERLNEGCFTEDDYIRSVLHFFRHDGFRYSDSPGVRERDALAGFLLRSKIGFCEDYASAFAILMRLKGYPCRLIAGYQGARYNPYNDLYVVKQSNAHAWDEVWIENQWRRVDPTSILRAGADDMGLSAAQAQDAADQSLSIDVANHRVTLASGRSLPSWMRQGLLDLQWRREEMEADWDDWVFSYDPDTQNRLAQALGLGSKVRTFFGLVCVGAVGLSGLIFALTILRRAPTSPIEKFYARFCRVMARRGAARAAWEGPLAYTDRLAGMFPEKRASLVQAGRIVANARYGSAPPQIDRTDLKSLLLQITASQASQASQASRASLATKVPEPASSSRDRN
jgi:transglutaminase-like putative cysteine protease